VDIEKVDFLKSDGKLSDRLVLMTAAQEFSYEKLVSIFMLTQLQLQMCYNFSAKSLFFNH